MRLAVTILMAIAAVFTGGFAIYLHQTNSQALLYFAAGAGLMYLIAVTGAYAFHRIILFYEATEPPADRQLRQP